MPFKAAHLFLLGAIVMAVLTAVLFMNLMKGQTAKKPKKEEAVKVVVASEFVPKGTVLTSVHLKKVDWPKKFVVPGSYYESTSKLMGKTVRSDILPGELFYKEKLSGDKSRGGLPVMIPAGHRAVAVSVSEVTGVAGFVKPGNMVDLVATFTVKAKGGKTHVTRTVLQNVLVLATAQSMVDKESSGVKKPEVLTQKEEDDKKGSKKKKKKKSMKQLEKERKAKEKAEEKARKRAKSVATITLALRPDQVERLALIEKASEVHVALRSEGDDVVETVPGVTTDDILLGTTGSGQWLDNFNKGVGVEDGGNTGPNINPPSQKSLDDFFKLEEMDPKDASEEPEDDSVSVEVIEGTTKSNVSF